MRVAAGVMRVMLRMSEACTSRQWKLRSVPNRVRGGTTTRGWWRKSEAGVLDGDRLAVVPPLDRIRRFPQLVNSMYKVLKIWYWVAGRKKKEKRGANRRGAGDAASLRNFVDGAEDETRIDLSCK